MQDYTDDGVPIVRLQMLPDDQLAHDARIARATVWEAKLAAILHETAFPDRPRPAHVGKVAPLYLEQAFALSEDPDLRAELMRALTRPSP